MVSTGHRAWPDRGVTACPGPAAGGTRGRGADAHVGGDLDGRARSCGKRREGRRAVGGESPLIHPIPQMINHMIIYLGRKYDLPGVARSSVPRAFVVSRLFWVIFVDQGFLTTQIYMLDFGKRNFVLTFLDLEINPMGILFSL